MSNWRKGFDDAMAGRPDSNPHAPYSDDWHEYDSGYQFGRDWLGE